MIRKEDCYKIGRLGKAHGVKGEVSLQFTDDVFDRADADYLILDVDGILVPFFMEEYRFRSDCVALVKFCDVDTQQRAAELTNCEVWFPRTLTPEDDEPTLAGLVGFEVIAKEQGARDKKQGTIGRIAAIDDSTANLLFELEDGTLIPANDDLIEDIDMEGRKITMNIPEGLLDI
jgi:16S rRNA processing protein RimM